MAAVVKFYPDWPRTTLTLNIPVVVDYSLRILLDHGGRLVQCAPERITYTAGEITFTVHHFIEDDRAFNLFADKHGWALPDTVIMKLIQEGVIRSEFDD